MKITDFAVYKEDGLPWALEEVLFICNSMGDTAFPILLSDVTSIRKFCYKEPDGLEVYPWFEQNINGLTPITYNEYKQLVTPTTENLKPGTKVKIVSKWNDKTNENKCGEMDHLLGKVVTLTNGEPFYLIREDARWQFNIHCFECLVLPEINYEELHTTIKGTDIMKELKKHPHQLTAPTLSETMMCTIAADYLTSKPRGKYLSLKIKNGVANAKSLIYQADATAIEDPRPYIQEIIAAEKRALKQKLVDLNLSVINYGYNIKLASLVQYSKDLQQAIYNNPSIDLKLTSCIAIYKLLDELAVLNIAITKAEETRTAYVCPYKWIAKFLTAENLNVPKAKELFHSNKLTIKLKDGWLSLHNYKEEITYRIEIKLNVSTGEYYI